MLTYKWTYDTDIFTATGPINEETIKLTVNAGKDIRYVVTAVTVEVSDENGCVSTKTCTFLPTGMECVEYTICPNPRDLKIINKITTCGGVSLLKVSKLIP